MTDLRDQLADPDAPIRLDRHQDIGGILRHLRNNARLSQRAVAKLIHVTQPAVGLRERGERSMHVGALIDHVRPFGLTVALVPATTRRDTGTGWPGAGALTPDRRIA